MYIPRGNYLTLKEFCLHLGGVLPATVKKAIRDGRLKGSVQIDKNTIIVPRDAILFSKAIKNGKYIGLTQWIKGNIETQEEVAGWEMKQRQLRKMREGDIRDDPAPYPARDEEHDYN